MVGLGEDVKLRHRVVTCTKGEMMMIMSSGFVMFVLMGIAICIGKLFAGDKSMGCLIPLLIVVLMLACFSWVIGLATMI